MATDSFPPTNRARLEEIFSGDAYVKGLGTELVDWDGGRASFRLRLESGHANFVGTVHGGALFSLAETAIGVASNSWSRVAGHVLPDRPLARGRGRLAGGLARPVLGDWCDSGHVPRPVGL